MNHQTSRNVAIATRKRKDKGDFDSTSFYKGNFGNSHKYLSLASGVKKNINSTTLLSSPSKTTNEPGFNSNIPVQSNRLLAGYMAHEFLTKGTLFGQKFDPARAEAIPVSAAEPKRKHGFEPAVKPMNRSYAEVAQLVKGVDGGSHIPGIVNPTQLAKWIQM